MLDRIPRPDRLGRQLRRAAGVVRLGGGAALLVVAFVAAAPAPAGNARTHPDAPERWPAPHAVLRSGTLSFTGRANVGAFVGTTTAVRGAVNGAADIANAAGWVEAGVASLSTRNALRDRDLRATMETQKYANMRFDLTGVTVEPSGAPGDSVGVALRGRLTLHGVTREVSIPAKLVTVADTIGVSGGFPIDLTDYRVGGLTRFLGALRMEKTIEVGFRLRFEVPPRTPRGEPER